MKTYACEMCGHKFLVFVVPGFAWVACPKCGHHAHELIRRGWIVRLALAILIPSAGIVYAALRFLPQILAGAR